MTRNQLKAALNQIDKAHRAAEKKFDARWAKKVDQMDWYERALEMHDESQGTDTPLDPLQCLLIVDKEQASDRHAYAEQRAKLEASKKRVPIK